MKSIKSASVLAISALLVACGGGGGGGSGSNGGAATETSTLVTSSVKGAVHYSGNAPYAVIDAEAPVFSKIMSLSNFTLDYALDMTGPFAFTTEGIFSKTFYDGSANSGKTAFSVGGTTWSYARFGILQNDGGVVNLVDATRHMPFFIANVFSPATFSDAVYAKGLVVGSQVGTQGGTTSDTPFKCDSSATYAHSSQSIELTLSNCFRTPIDGTSSPLYIAGTISMNSQGATANSFRLDSNERLAVKHSEYKLAGPSGQELVGAITLTGTTNPVANKVVTFAFGAQK